MRQAAFLAIGLLSVLASAARADWPERVFVPYVYLGAGDDFRLTDCNDACGQKFYTLAFIIADKQANPAWDGRITLEKNHYADQIAAIRERGGDCICSFGGEGGIELAIAEKDPAALESKYRAVIDRYQFTWLDFDIEGKALENIEANARRNSVIAKLQATNPKLIISYTLPVDPKGITDASQKLLADAKAKGVRVHSANVMTMFFGPRFNKGKQMSDISIASATKAYEQCQAIDDRIRIGLCPLIGRNDQMNETFDLDDAKRLKDWAESTPWVCSLSFWCSNRDAGTSAKKDGNTRSGIEQKSWDFTSVFKTFGAK